MKFKTKDEAIKWLDTALTESEGEFVLTPLADLQTEYDAARKGYTDVVSESKKFKERAQKAEKELQTVSAELDGYKKAEPGEWEKKFQEANKRASEIEAWRHEHEPKLAERDQLLQTIADMQSKEKRQTILSAVSKVAEEKFKIPHHVIANDFERLVVPDLEMDDAGKIWTRGDNPKPVDHYLAERQKQCPHWQPVSIGSGAGQGQKNTSQPVSLLGAIKT